MASLSGPVAGEAQRTIERGSRVRRTRASLGLVQDTALLQDLDTRSLWRFFLELSKIPRGSGAEAAAAGWVAEQAMALGCEVMRDAVGNVRIRQHATPGREQRPPVALQAHVDMVCEKNDGTTHDFLHDPIRLVLEGDTLRANGTTLGADNGVGVSAALAVLASRDVAHGPLEVLITVDEESGLTGAHQLQPGWLRARYLLNLDNEEEGVVTIGCAGGVDSIATRTVRRVAPGPGKQCHRVKVLGLKGGHSGDDIQKGRGNAVRILGQILNRLIDSFGIELSSVKGGNKRNAIPREASAVFFMDSTREIALAAELELREAQWRGALGALDSGLRLELESATAETAMSHADSVALIRLLLTAPHGVEEMSPMVPGFVQTSTNLGVVNTRGDLLEVNLLTRSSIEPSKAALAARIAAACGANGFDHVLEADYPGWKPDPAASLVKTVTDVHQQVFGTPMRVMAIHAGLECGLIGEKHPGMEMVSFGPSMWDVHTPDERVSLRSVANFWKLLARLLETL